MSPNDKYRLEDYFTGAELVELLEAADEIGAGDVVLAFEDELERLLPQLSELMGVPDDD